MQVIVNPETDFVDERFAIGQVLLAGRGGPAATSARLSRSRVHQGWPIVRFAGIDSIDDAEALAGAELWLAASELEPLPAGTFYRHDLVGCDVGDSGMARASGR